VTLLGIVIASAGCRGDPAPARPETHHGRWYEEERLLYHGIPCRISFTPRDPELARRAWAYLEHVDEVFNGFKSNSEVGRLNRRADSDAGYPISISNDLEQAIRLSMRVHRRTGGSFDPTIGPLIRLWKRAARLGRLPEKQALTAALKRCGIHKLRLKDGHLRLQPDLELALGGIVKGIAADRVIALLREGGASAALAQIGGEVGALGLNRRGRPHVVGVQHPESGAGTGTQTKMWTAIRDPGPGISCATSGNYEQPLTIEGRRIYHIVDPRSGEPVDVDVLSVTVAFPSTGKAGLADGLSTAAAVLGPQRALPLIQKLGGQALLLVRGPRGIEEHKTSGWDRLVVRGGDDR
jgi:thiamine biosynthesis lipoprotein